MEEDKFYLIDILSDNILTWLEEPETKEKALERFKKLEALNEENGDNKHLIFLVKGNIIKTNFKNK